MVQNKHLHGSKQTLIWFKTNTYMVQNKHLYGAVQHDCVLFNSYMFRPQSIIIRPQEQYLKKKVKMQCKICYRVYRAGAILKMPYCVISLSLSLWCNSPQWARASSLSKLHDRTQTSHIRQDSSGSVISPRQRPLPDNTRHSQETGIYAAGGIRTNNPSKRAAADPIPQTAQPLASAAICCNYTKRCFHEMETMSTWRCCHVVMIRYSLHGAAAMLS